MKRRFESPPSPRVGPAVDVADPEQERRPLAANDTAFVLRAIEYSGNTVFSDAALHVAAMYLVDQEVTVATLFEIAAEITVRYRNAGFILSRAIVPPQDVTDGQVQIRIIEGYIDRVVVPGGLPRAGTWAGHKQKILASRPIESAVLERAVLLMNDLAGYSVQATLRPSETEVGASTLVLEVEHAPVSLYLDANNRGTRFLGPYQFEAGVTVNSLASRFESTSARIIHAFLEELTVVTADHTELLGAFGTTMTLSGTFVRTRPGGILEQQDSKGQSFSGAASINHPFIRTRALNVSGSFRFDYLNSDNDLLGTNLTGDQITTLRGIVTADAVDRFAGVNLGLFELTQGLDIFGASDGDDADLSRPGAGGGFTKIYLRAQRLQRIGRGFNLLVQASGQYGIDRLLSAEQFGFGGEDFGRGYDAAEILGDHGVSTLIELQWGRAFSFAYLQGVQLFTSYDYGAVWNRDDPVTGLNPPDGRSDTASSWAAGFRANVVDWLSARFMVGLPLTRASTIDRDDGEKKARVFFGVTARY